MYVLKNDLTIMQVCTHVVAKVNLGSKFRYLSTGKRDNAGHVQKILTTINKTAII